MSNQETKFIYPTISLHSDKPQTLANQYQDILVGLEGVLKTMSSNRPNARNYTSVKDWQETQKDFENDLQDIQNLISKYETVLEVFCENNLS